MPPISKQRHDNMAAIHSKDTKPEWIVRRGLWSRGFRYRLNSPRLPGHPDLVLRKYRTCIFVNGCFWHGHEGCKLAEMGWHCITVWECELTPKRREEKLRSLAFTLNHIWLQDHSVPSLSPSIPKPYPMLEEESQQLSIAAEDLSK